MIDYLAERLSTAQVLAAGRINMTKRRTPEDATLLDVLIDGFEKNGLLLRARAS
jgi:hypothetical protein